MSFVNNSTVSDAEANGSLFSLFERIWYSLDDIFVCFGVFLVATQLAKSTYGCMRNYFRLSFYVSQATHFALLFTAVIFLIGHLVGSETAISFLGGLSIGLGYALQPYIVSLLAGGTLLTMETIREGDELRRPTVCNGGACWVIICNDQTRYVQDVFSECNVGTDALFGAPFIVRLWSY